MFIPAQPDKVAWDCILGNLIRLKKGESRDFGTKLLTCQGTSLDDARVSLAQLVWDHCELGDLSEPLLRAEWRQRGKQGRCSEIEPFFKEGSQLRMAVHRYFTKRWSSICENSARYATERLRSWLPKGLLRSTSLVDAAVKLSDKKAACGWPHMVTRKTVPYEYYSEAEGIEFDGYDPATAWLYPGQLYCRGASAGIGKVAKARAIYGFSLVPNLLKRRVLTPVYNKLIKRVAFSANKSRAAVDLAVTGILNRSHGSDILSIDFQNFDGCAPDRAIKECFSALRYWFCDADQALVRWCQEAFERTGIFIPSRREEFDLLPGEDRVGGVPSGSVLTNLINSMVNYWAVTYAAHRLGVRVGEFLLQGDDGVYLFDDKWNVQDLSEVLLVELGMIMSPSKCVVSPDEVHFLQMVFARCEMTHDRMSYGVRPIMRVLNGMGSSERPLGGDDLYDSFRWLQQVDNASAHPCYKRLLRWLVDHDAWLPELLSRATLKDPKISAIARAVLGDGEWGQDKLRRLYEMPSVRLISDHLSGVCSL